MEATCGGSGMSRETMSTQPEALRLADDLDHEFAQGRISNYNGRKAAAELRRLHEALETEQKTAVSPGKGTGFNYFRALDINVLQPALETKQKTAVSPDGGTGFIDGVWHDPGPTAWRCQCGKAYTVTCISSKPKEKNA